jgi:hypothetical protein
LRRQVRENIVSVDYGHIFKPTLQQMIGCRDAEASATDNKHKFTNPAQKAQRHL